MRKTATLRTAGDLIGAGLAPEERREALDLVARTYAIGVTETIAGLIDPKDPRDPIARQFIPDAAELVSRADELVDPIGDHPFSPVEGVVHRYPDRALLKLLHVCPVYCRFCFRRETVGPRGGATRLGARALGAALSYIAAHSEIWEVILTGGDPLTLSPRRLSNVMARLEAIDHVKIVRLHTRVPVADPEAIKESLVDCLRTSGKTVYVALHANHPRELTAQARAACARLIDAGIPMLSQSVLLAGVNDDIETLAALMRAFVEARIKPYYLHQLDFAPGTARFRVPISRGRALMAELRGKTSGLCQPAYMLDIPGGHGKSPIGPNYITESSQPDTYGVTNHRGETHQCRG
ncbi:lysine-2,3-aminomutase-like protein [Methylocapsa palsarum]|uniref:Lysine 2,3-aminomutase n=1 Tax=Methylocapsa palsarum TaxID=1612308 RepID=A0A1I3X576_9HYPH|nr:lysine-2,3-aminomutase-like protein [Methylocapsa palsarum]SFK14459.1 lysine 2,3-aminomutase [Methylocapsa palsarum]